MQGYAATWIRNLAQGTNVTVLAPSECSAIPSCSTQPTPICPYVQSCDGGGTTTQQARLPSCLPLLPACSPLVLAGHRAAHLAAHSGACVRAEQLLLSR